MSKRDKGRLPPFVPLFRHTINSPAWQAMSMGARATFFELKANYNTKAQNAVYLAARIGAKKLNTDKSKVPILLRELEHYGFIVEVRSAHLGVDGVGKATLYRLTDCYYAGQSPTYDFQNWNGELFTRPKRKTGAKEIARLNELKKQNPVRRLRTPRPTATDKQQERRMTENASKRPTATDKGNDHECPTATDITSFTISQAERVLPLSAKPKLVWSKPVLTEVTGAEKEELLKILARTPAFTAQKLRAM